MQYTYHTMIEAFIQFTHNISRLLTISTLSQLTISIYHCVIENDINKHIERGISCLEACLMIKED